MYEGLKFKEWRAPIELLKTRLPELSQEASVREASVSGDGKRYIRAVLEAFQNTLPTEAQVKHLPKTRMSKNETTSRTVIPLEEMTPELYAKTYGETNTEVLKNCRLLAEVVLGKKLELPEGDGHQTTNLQLQEARQKLEQLTPQSNRVTNPQTWQAATGVIVQPHSTAVQQSTVVQTNPSNAVVPSTTTKVPSVRPSATEITDSTLANATLEPLQEVGIPPSTQVEEDNITKELHSLIDKWDTSTKPPRVKGVELSAEVRDSYLREDKAFFSEGINLMEKAIQELTDPVNLSSTQKTLQKLKEEAKSIKLIFFTTPLTDDEAKHNLEAFLLTLQKTVMGKKSKRKPVQTPDKGFGTQPKPPSLVIPTLLEELSLKIEASPFEDVLHSFNTLSENMDRLSGELQENATRDNHYFYVMSSRFSQLNKYLEKVSPSKSKEVIFDILSQWNNLLK